MKVYYVVKPVTKSKKVDGTNVPSSIFEINEIDDRCDVSSLSISSDDWSIAHFLNRLLEITNVFINCLYPIWSIHPGS